VAEDFIDAECHRFACRIFIVDVANVRCPAKQLAAPATTEVQRVQIDAANPVIPIPNSDDFLVIDQSRSKMSENLRYATVLTREQKLDSSLDIMPRF
jgi:hypothetical protein